ncbi:ABC transporter permease [Christiangramia forsetii]|uniref:LolC-like FtsX family membrane protein (Predicted permease) n=2 Tax=Christiangramia forsetii TaxID=411153 RepID=A0M6N0_CHRFK|nr:FtsX-like permease family protein [Christiangramia forsetii]GGG29988.1 membrane protein [Christiangramia forsetii]CAL68275.1 LolC-like FtsX family membrane protein (predicted permease) [Christiangramia forsetii KT0803]
MKFPLYIAKRYLFTKSKSNAINIITIIAAIGVFAGAFSLFIVLSGFSGLRDFSLSFSNEFDPDLKAFPQEGKVIKISEEQINQLQQIDGVETFSKIVEERVILTYKSKEQPAYIKGVDEKYRSVNKIDSSIVFGTWLTNSEPQVVIGNGLSRLLDVGTFNYQNLLKIMVPKPGKGAITMTNLQDAFNTRQTIVSGIYSVNEELDDKYVFTHLNFAKDLLNLGAEEYSAIEFKLRPGVSTDQVTEEINKVFDGNATIKTRAELNDALNKMLNSENLFVYLIFTLVLTIALFNVVGSIIVMILDKRENIKTLHSLGATPNQIKNIFFLQGMLMTGLGGIIGLAVAVVLIILQMNYDLVMITPNLPYPVAMEIENIFIVLITIFTLGFIASYIAAGRSKKALV